MEKQFTFLYGDTPITVESSYKDKKTEIGAVKEIFINPDNLCEHYDDVVSREISPFITAIIGVVFTYIGAEAIFLG